MRLNLQAAIEKHVLKWGLANEADLVFVLIYSKTVFSNITYVDELLNKFKEASTIAHLMCSCQSRLHLTHCR